MFTTIAEILHAKDPAKFAALVAHLIKVGLLKPEAAAGDSRFVSAEQVVPARRELPEQAA